MDSSTFYDIRIRDSQLLHQVNFFPLKSRVSSLNFVHFTLFVAQSEIIPSSICQKVQPKGEGHICYWLGSESGTWVEAQAQCEQDGGSLARISDLLDNMHVVELLKEKDVTQAWIGLRESFSSWQWLSGKILFYHNFAHLNFFNRLNSWKSVVCECQATNNISANCKKLKKSLIL